MEDAKRPSKIDLIEAKLEAMAEELAAAQIQISAVYGTLDGAKNSLQTGAPEPTSAPLVNPGILSHQQKNYEFDSLAFIFEGQKWTAEQAAQDPDLLDRLLQAQVGVLRQV